MDLIDDAKELPLELFENRNIIEGNILGVTFKDLSILKDFKDLEIGDFLTESGRRYFSIAGMLHRQGYKTVDEVTIMKLCESIPNLQGKINYATIHGLTSCVEETNSDGYYDDLIKSNMIISLYKKGFNVIDNLKKFKSMNSNQVYEFYDYQLNNIAIKKQVDMDVYDLTNPLEYLEYLKKCDQGLNKGLSYSASSFKILNYNTNGLHRPCFTLVGGGTGGGKSTILIPLYILPIVEQGEKALVIVNEEEAEAWQQRMLTTIINSRLNKHFSRDRFRDGKFTNDEWDILKEGVNFFENYKNCIQLVKIRGYNSTNIKKVVKKYSKLGYKYVFVDTLKPSTESSSDSDWKEFYTFAHALYDVCCVQENMSLIATVQLATSSIHGKRYLTRNHIGKSKGIAEIAGVIILMRTLFKDEYTGKDCDVKPYRFKKDQSTGKWTKEREAITLDINKDYLAIFLDKNRYGKDSLTLIAERNLSFCSFRELGFCEIPQDFS